MLTQYENGGMQAHRLRLAELERDAQRRQLAREARRKDNRKTPRRSLARVLSLL